MADRDPYPSEKQDRFIVRLPDGMRDRIKVAAEANNRSMNAEIVATLEDKYPAPALDRAKKMRQLLSLYSRCGDISTERESILTAIEKSDPSATAHLWNRIYELRGAYETLWNEAEALRVELEIPEES